MLAGARQRPAVAALDALAAVEGAAARRARAPDREPRRLALRAGSSHERPDLRVRLDRGVGQRAADMLVGGPDRHFGVAGLRRHAHVHDVEGLGALDAHDGRRQDARVAHDVAAVLLAHQFELHLETAQDTVADEGTGGAHVARAPRLAQDVRHLPHVVGDALFREGGVAGAQGLERRRAYGRAGPRPVHSERAARRRETPLLLDDGDDDNQPDDDEEEESGPGAAHAGRAVEAASAAETSASEAAPAAASEAAAASATPGVAAAPARSRERRPGLEQEHSHQSANRHRFHREESTRSSRRGSRERRERRRGGEGAFPPSRSFSSLPVICCYQDERPTPLGGGGRLLGRPARLATADTSETGSTGFITCLSKPAAAARSRSSPRA